MWFATTKEWEVSMPGCNLERKLLPDSHHRTLLLCNQRCLNLFHVPSLLGRKSLRVEYTFTEVLPSLPWEAKVLNLSLWSFTYWMGLHYAFISHKILFGPWMIYFLKGLPKQLALQIENLKRCCSLRSLCSVLFSCFSLHFLWMASCVFVASTTACWCPPSVILPAQTFPSLSKICFYCLL